MQRSRVPRAFLCFRDFHVWKCLGGNLNVYFIYIAKGCWGDVVQHNFLRGIHDFVLIFRCCASRKETSAEKQFLQPENTLRRFARASPSSTMQTADGEKEQFRLQEIWSNFLIRIFSTQLSIASSLHLVISFHAWISTPCVCVWG